MGDQKTLKHLHLTGIVHEEGEDEKVVEDEAHEAEEDAHRSSDPITGSEIKIFFIKDFDKNRRNFLF